VRRQLKNYLVIVGNVSNQGDEPQFGTQNIRATDALAAAKQADLNLGKRQYVSEVQFQGFVTVSVYTGEGEAAPIAAGEPVEQPFYPAPEVAQ
jgi:hypothetical protein